jgi:hypothetical protein
MAKEVAGHATLNLVAMTLDRASAASVTDGAVRNLGVAHDARAAEGFRPGRRRRARGAGGVPGAATRRLAGWPPTQRRGNA